jgi:broad specificity phosphatase PhoE
VSKLFFVRHGESEANVLKVISNRGLRHGLTEKGRRQAAELASNLRGSEATRIYSSPLLRALQTAEILSSALGVNYDVTDALREFDCGIAEGRSDPESWDLHRQVMEDWLQRGELDARIVHVESYLVVSLLNVVSR